MATRKHNPKGLRLTLPGAPGTPHVVPGVPGFYRPDQPTPVGSDGDPVDEQRARELHDDPAIPLELVDMTAKDADAARRALATHLAESRQALTNARRDARETGTTPEEVERITDEQAALAGKDGD